MTVVMMTEAWRAGYLLTRQLEEGLWIAVAPLTLGRARIIKCDPLSIFDGW